jgi:hypothetical protein
MFMMIMIMMIMTAIIIAIITTCLTYCTDSREDTSCIKYGMSVAVKAPAAKERYQITPFISKISFVFMIFTCYYCYR